MTAGAVFCIAIAALLVGWLGGMMTLIAGEPMLLRIGAFLVDRCTRPRKETFGSGYPPMPRPNPKAPHPPPGPAR